MYGKALEKKIWSLEVVNIRDSAEDKHKTVDDTPFGGGNGMLLKPDVLGKSIDKNAKKGKGSIEKPIILHHKETGHKHLLAGNTRLTAGVQDHKAKVAVHTLEY